MKIEIPEDGWGERDGVPITPRPWQEQALPVIVEHYNRQSPSRGVVYAVTGSGKSVLISQACACVKPDNNEAIVVSTSRQKLVRQIRETIKDRMEVSDFMAEESVGSYFADSKDIHNKVIVCCNDSIVKLAEALTKIGRQCAFYICDELHRSESKTMKRGYDLLLPRMSLGLSATPYRSNPAHGISNFDEVIVKFSVVDGLKEGCIVPWEVRNWEGEQTDLDTACIAMMKACGKFGIVNAVSIDDAKLFAQKASDAGYAVKPVHCKLSDAEIDDVIEEFRSGAIDAIVHVDLLSEGVDICEILHLTLRRPVASRNRFVQEVGRGIRAYKDKITGEVKEKLIINDVHDLFGIMKLGGYEAVLSGDFDPDEPEEATAGERMERGLQQQVFECMRHLTSVKSGREPLNSTPLATYLSQLCSVFDTFGLIDREVTSRDWRRSPASQKQISAMEKLKWALGRKQVPSIHKTALEILTGVGSVMSRGMASDLISIETSLAEKSTWPKFSQLDQVVKDGLDRHAKRKSTIVPMPKKNAVIKPKAPPKMEQGILFEELTRK